MPEKSCPSKTRWRSYSVDSSPWRRISLPPIVSVFVYGTLPNVPEYVIRGDGSVHRLVTDRIGSVRLIVDVATGAVLAQRDYDSFGRIVFDTNPILVPFGFAGGIYDDDTELTQFGVREYDAEVGRFTAKDPSLIVWGNNFYVYANNSPLSNIDITGRNTLVLSRPELLLAIGFVGIASLTPAGQDVASDIAAGVSCDSVGGDFISDIEPPSLADMSPWVWVPVFLSKRTVSQPRPRDPDPNCDAERTFCNDTCEDILFANDRFSQGFAFNACYETCLIPSGCSK